MQSAYVMCTETETRGKREESNNILSKLQIDSLLQIEWNPTDCGVVI